MIKFTDLNKKIKRDTEYIDNVMFGNYRGNECTCLLTFKYLGEIPSEWSSELLNRLNNYIVDCHAFLSCSCSTSKNLVLKFTVRLS